MDSAMSLTCSKRKATTQDVGSSSNESCKRREICSTNDDNQSSSPPTSLSRNWNHPVFPSFHGADVRKTILSHILVSFKRKAIYPFIDDEIDRSKSIGPELIEAIRSSKIAIVLLSKNYASSSWCLNELAEIINCRKVLGQTVMTVFYEVDPSDIRKQAGDFGNAFKRTCEGRTKEEIDKWSKALEEVATIAGEHSARWSNEAAMIEKIAADVLNKLTNSTPSKGFEDYVGMRAHMERMLSLLRLDLDEVRMIGIWGPPGIGKTTIARVVFNQLSSSFQLSTIMVNVKGCFPRLCFDEYNVQLQLQNQMLSQITNHKELKISHLGVASELLKDKKVLLVIDKVDHPRQLDALAKETLWFGSGSRIIVTTEDRRLLKAHDINHIYKVKYPSSDEAFQIFCMHAFRQKLSPDDGLYRLAKEVSYLAGELPLGLKVLGSALRGKSKEEWEMILPRLMTSLDGEIESIIKFSYDALFDEDKYLFLYISCIFMGELPHKVEGILASQFPNVKLGLHILTEKSLIFIDDYSRRIAMNVLVWRFGIETARKKFVRNGITKGELLFDERDICEVFNEDTTDNNHIKAIKLYLSEKMEKKLNISDKTIKKMSDLQFINIEGHEDEDDMYPSESELQSLFFQSRKIRSLEWSCFGNICLPSTFNTEFLVNLRMPFSKLEKLWEGDKVLKNLKWMDLSWSKYLKELADLSTASKLEELILRGCESLVELPDLSTATKLEKIILEGCKSLVELPDLPTATKLRELDLRDCSSLVKFPSSFVDFNNLENIGLSDCRSLVELPFYIGTAKNLQRLDLHECSSLVKFPNLSTATKLENLILTGCKSLVELPDLPTATKLRELDLRDCSSLVKFPSSFVDFNNLENIGLSDCRSLVELPFYIGTAKNLQRLDLHECSSLVKFPNLSTATKLENLILTGCKSLVELPDLPTATKLRTLCLYDCFSLVKFPSSFGNFNNLEDIDLTYCRSLVELPFDIGTATNLQRLKLQGCSSLVKLPWSIGNLINLEEILLDRCSSLVEIPFSIGNLQKLKELKMEGCSKLEALPTNINLESLSTLDLRNCSQLKSFPDISTNIWDLYLTGTAINEIPWTIMLWPCLRRLCLKNCNNLVSLPLFPDSLEYLDASNCKSLERLDCTFNNPEIELLFSNCFKLNQEARDLIINTSCKYAVLPGTEVPPCFNSGRCTGGGLVTINLNESTLPTSFRFKVCITLVKGDEETSYGEDERGDVWVISMMVKQKDHIFPCRPSSPNMHKGLREHIYIFEVAFEVEAEEVTSTELVLELKTKNFWKSKTSWMWKIEEWGLMQI